MVKWLILRILVPAIIFGIFCSLRHLDFHMFDGLGCRMLCKKCGCVACGRSAKAQLRNKVKELGADNRDARSKLFGIGVAIFLLPIARMIFKHGGIAIRWKWWFASVPVGLLLGGVAGALVFFGAIPKELVPTLLRWHMYADVFGAMYWMTGTDPWTKL